MREAILKLGSAAVVATLICVVITNRSLTNRITKQEDALLKLVNATIGENGLFDQHLQHQHGMKLATVEAGLTSQESSNLYTSAKEALKIKSWEESKIERIKKDYEIEIRSAKNSIALGYTACRMGLNLSNYLAEYEAGMAKSLERRIAEVKESK